MRTLRLIGVLASMAAASVLAEDLEEIVLPAPNTEGGRPLMQVLKARQSRRAFDSRSLSPQVLSDLLWAAAGINRPDSGKRTAPSALNWQEIQVYAILAEGAYRYDAASHVLRPVAAGDLRPLAGQQSFVKDAPLNLLYVADYTRMNQVPADKLDVMASADAGFVAENVCLFCASEDLANVVRASVDQEGMAKALGLPATMKIILAHTVGYPAP